MIPIKVNKPVIKSTNSCLTAYGGTSITPTGTCNLVRKEKSQSHTIKFYVVSVDANPILGLSACRKLGLILKVHLKWPHQSCN